tara:strand:+ start:2149 stop:2682 length:534 start_codon:yes stop_codon:yes gene_type:complete
MVKLPKLSEIIKNLVFYSIHWNTTNNSCKAVPIGFYLSRTKIGDFRQTKKTFPKKLKTFFCQGRIFYKLNNKKIKEFIMKSYIQGLITGGLFVFTFMVLLGHTDYSRNDSENIGRYTYNFSTEKDTEDLVEIFDNKSGKLFISSKEKGRGFEVRMIDFKGLEERYNSLLKESLSKIK